MKRRNLSGIYIFDQFHDEVKRHPTCFEDCQERTQDKWLDYLEQDTEAMRNLIKCLAKTIREIGDKLDIYKE